MEISRSIQDVRTHQNYADNLPVEPKTDESACSSHVSEKDTVSINNQNETPRTEETKLQSASGQPIQLQKAKENSSPESANQSNKTETDNKAETDAKTYPEKKWTLLFYEAGDNDLQDYLIHNMKELEFGSATNDINYVVQLDRGKKPTDKSGGWGGCRRYKLERGNDPYNIQSPVLKDLGQVNMSDPKILQDFLEWGMEKFPAQHYMLVIADHGGGWGGAVQDNSHGGWMSLPDIGKAIGDAEKTKGKKFDVLSFDACLMGQTEVAYELRDLGDYLVASEETEGGHGWSYEDISKRALRRMNSVIAKRIAGFEPEEMAVYISKLSAMDRATLPTLSAIDLGKMKQVAETTDKFAEAIIKSDTPNSVLRALMKKTQPFGGFKDHYDFCKRIVESGDVTDEKLKESAKETMDAIKSAVIHEEHSDKYPDAHGLSINLPTTSRDIHKKYKDIKFAQDTHWDEALERMGKTDFDKNTGKA